MLYKYAQVSYQKQTDRRGNKKQRQIKIALSCLFAYHFDEKYIWHV